VSTKRYKITELIEECWNKKNRANSLYEIFSPNIIHELILGKRLGRGSFCQMADDWCQSFPDMCVTMTDIEEFGHSVKITAEVKATYLKPLQDQHSDKEDVVTKSAVLEQLVTTSPTGKRISYEIEEIYFFDNQNQVTRFISYTDVPHLFNQINLSLSKEDYAFQAVLKKNYGALIKRLKELHHPHLTSREMECLSLNLLGLSAKQIGIYLRVSYRTIEAHLYHAFHLLGLKGRKQCLEQIMTTQTLLMWHDLGKLVLQKSIGKAHV